MSPDWTLKEFLSWWCVERVFRPPIDQPVSIDGSAYGVVLYRKGPFQVQLFIAAPGSEIPDHVHPNVDSYEIYFSGQMALRKLGKYETWPADWEVVGPGGRLAIGGQILEILSTDSHGGFIGPQGGSFLSFQKWKNGVKPTNVADDWSYTGTEQRAKVFVKGESA